MRIISAVAILLMCASSAFANISGTSDTDQIYVAPVQVQSN